MANGQIGKAVRFVLRAVAAPAGGALSDARLLERFTATRDEAAFETLLWRHGPMVLGVCRRLLRHPQDAEDAFQATFLVLARKAGAIGKGESVGSWLYKVAYRAALRARARAARLPRSGATWPEPSAPAPDAPWLADDLRPVLDAELNRLPEKYRAPLVLHYLEGKTVEQAARELACPAGTLSSRLARARELLRGRLARRGVGVTAALLGAGLAGEAAAGPVPAALALSAAHGALLGAGPAAAAALARGVLHGMALARVKLAAAVLLAVGLAGSGAGLIARQAPPQPRAQAPRPQADRPAAAGQEKAGEGPKDPLPAGALARLGTFRLRQGAAVRAVAFSADGKVLASAAGDWTIRLWDTATGREVGRLGSGLGLGPIFSMGMSGDGKVIAAVHEAKAGRTARLWGADGKELRRLAAPPGDVKAVAITPDGKVLATAERAGRIGLWDVTTGKLLRRLAGHGNSVLAVAFSADGKALLSGGQDRNLRLWDVASGRELRRFAGHANALTGVAFGPGGKRLGSTSLDGTVRIWDAATGGLVRQFNNHGAITRCVAFAPDGKSVVSGGDDRTLRQWEVDTGRELRRLPGPRGPVLCAAFSADGKRLAAGTGVFQVHLWDAASGRELHPADGHRGSIHGLAFAPDGRLLATGGHDWAVCLWDLAARRQRWRAEGHTGGVEGVAFSPDGKALASASYDGTVALWDAANGRELRRFRQGSGVVCLAFSPDGKALASGGGDQLVYVWDVTSGAARRFAGHTGRVAAVAFSGDGAFLASAADDKTVRVWSAATGEQLHSLPGSDRVKNAVAFAPDGRTVAVHDGEVIRLWELATGKERGRFAVKKLIALAFAADGRHLLLSPSSLEVRVHDLLAGRQVRQFPGHLNWTHCLATAPDGQLLASGSSDGTVLLWGPGAAGPRPAARRLLPDRLRLAWDELGADDAAAAYRALWDLAGAPGQSLPLLKKGLAAPAAGPDDRRVAALLADLDHDEFAVREKAEAALAKLGPAAGPALRKALEGAPSAEVRTRVERLLKGRSMALPAGEELRRLRALEVLEQINTPEARRLLEEAARGGSADRVGREAKAALARLARRPAATP